MKKIKDFLKILETYKQDFKDSKIEIINGFLGVINEKGILKNTTYIGNDYISIDGYIYYIKGDKSKLISKLN